MSPQLARPPESTDMVSEDRATIRREYVTSTGLGVTPAGARV